MLGAAAPDEDVLAYVVEDDRYVLTCDRDFGKLVFQDRQELPPGIIFIRFEPQDVEEIIPRILAVLKSPDLAGKLVVIGDAGNRLTELPR